MSSGTSSTIVGTRTIYLKDPVPIKPVTPADILNRHRLRTGENPLECSLHTLPELLKREFDHVFREECKDMPDGIRSFDENDQTPLLLAIPTNQKAREDLVAVGDHIEDEKNRLLNVFMNFAHEFTNKIRSKGHWADYIDPCSGLPMLATHNHNKVYSEVDGMEVLLNYKSYNAGFCKILIHPKWGSAVYPATIFAYAPWGLVKNLLSEYK